MDGQKKILVIEDELSYQRILTTKLNNEHFAVITAENGEAGLAAAIKELPDLILLDLMLPKIDGLTVLRRLRSYNEWGKTVPVFILTALTSRDEERNRAMSELTPTYYIEKGSAQLSDLIEKIKDKLNI